MSQNDNNVCSTEFLVAYHEEIECLWMSMFVTNQCDYKFEGTDNACYNIIIIQITWNNKPLQLVHTITHRSYISTYSMPAYHNKL